MSDGTARPSALDCLRRALANTSELHRPLADLELSPTGLRRIVGLGKFGELRPASVLVAVVHHPDEERILLTRRADGLRRHGGQVSLPGGVRDTTDADATAAALREAHEEVGLDPQRVRILGYLDDYPTGTGFRITPVVGWVDAPFAPRISTREVAETFEIPLALALDRSRYERKSLRYNGLKLPFYELQFQEHRIWGATAGILRALCLRVEEYG